ncbi:MAG: hypothetical protein RLZZ427_1647 [Pseudomonadota bacterium]|jgi:predicted Zn finger-like uncharacterized protein
MFNGVIMIIACPACGTRYVVPDSAIGADGRTVRCAKCRSSWFQDGPQLASLAPETTEPAATQPVAMATSADPAPEPIAEPAAPPPAANTDASEIDTGETNIGETDAGETDIGDSTWADDAPSQFVHEPPFGGRRNPARMWTLAAAIFAVVALGTVGAAAWYGLPDWMPFARPLFAASQPGLKLDFPANQQDRHELADHTWFFNANGTVTNISPTPRRVPAILIVLRDARGRIVYTAEVQSPKPLLAPGESVTINEALTAVPQTGVSAEFGWKPGS